MANEWKAKKQRLDLLLVERGFFPSREQARAAIMAGEVLVGANKIEKAGAAVDPAAEIRLLGNRLPYVSRGGLKLEKAICCFHLDLHGLTVIDIGSSTGGFVDCALQNGAQRVYAVDVGRNQLAWKLRNDARVIVLEKTNARFLDRQTIPEQADLITADVSFISLALALPAAVKHLLKPGGSVVALIKPQFEAGRAAVGKGGVVRDKKVHRQVLERMLSVFAEMGLGVQALDFSPITGADGNIEYLIHAQKGLQQADSFSPQQIIDTAWSVHHATKQQEMED